MLLGKIINIYDIDFNEELSNLIEGIKELGFNMISKIGEKFFVPCYNEQNGYYSGNLELILTKKQKMDISEFVKEDIY